MTAGEMAHPGFRAALDRIAAGLAQPFAARDIILDLCLAQRLERDRGIGEAPARLAARVDHADRREHMVAPAREAVQQRALNVRRLGRRQDRATARDRRVARDHHFALAALDRRRLLLSEAQGVEARNLPLARTFINMGAHDAIGDDADAGEQVAPTRRGGGQNELGRHCAALGRALMLRNGREGTDLGKGAGAMRCHPSLPGRREAARRKPPAARRLRSAIMIVAEHEDAPPRWRSGEEAGLIAGRGRHGRACNDR